MVDAKTLKLLQRELQLGLLRYAERGADDSKTLYSAGWKVLPRTQFDNAILKRFFPMALYVHILHVL